VVFAVLKVENDVDSENKSEMKTADVASQQKPRSRISSDSRHKLSSKSDVHALKSTTPSSSQAPRPKQSTDSATVSTTALRELNAAAADKLSVGISNAGARKPTTRYRPAHHSAPFKTMPLPPGRSKLPPVSRPGSGRKNPARMSQMVGGRGIDHHGGKASVAGRSVETRGKVCDGSQTDVTGIAAVTVDDGGEKCPVSCSQNTLVHSLDCDVTGVSDSITCDGIPHGGISTDSLITRSSIDVSHRSDDVKTTFGALSTAISQQSGASAAGRAIANEDSRRSKAVVQSPTVMQQDTNPLHTDQNSTENSTSSFILHRDGHVL